MTHKERELADALVNYAADSIKNLTPAGKEKFIREWIAKSKTRNYDAHGKFCHQWLLAGLQKAAEPMRKLTAISEPLRKGANMNERQQATALIKIASENVVSRLQPKVANEIRKTGVVPDYIHQQINDELASMSASAGPITSLLGQPSTSSSLGKLVDDQIAKAVGRKKKPPVEPVEDDDTIEDEDDLTKFLKGDQQAGLHFMRKAAPSDAQRFQSGLTESELEQAPGAILSQFTGGDGPFAASSADTNFPGEHVAVPSTEDEDSEPGNVYGRGNDEGPGIGTHEGIDYVRDGGDFEAGSFLSEQELAAIGIGGSDARSVKLSRQIESSPFTGMARRNRQEYIIRPATKERGRQK